MELNTFIDSSWYSLKENHATWLTFVKTNAQIEGFSVTFWKSVFKIWQRCNLLRSSFFLKLIAYNSSIYLSAEAIISPGDFSFDYRTKGLIW